LEVTHKVTYQHHLKTAMLMFLPQSTVRTILLTVRTLLSWIPATRRVVDLILSVRVQPREKVAESQLKRLRATLQRERKKRASMF